MSLFLALTGVSFGLSATIAVIYRFTTKPAEMRKIKDDMKFYKIKMNEAKKAGETDKMNLYAQEMMKASQGQFKHNMKPMMITMMLFFLILGWLHTTFGAVEVSFADAQQATFSHGGSEYPVLYTKTEDGFSVGVDLDRDGSFSAGETFSDGQMFSNGEGHWQVSATTEGFFLFQSVKENTVSFSPMVAELPFSLPFLGLYLNWFWWYIFISMPATFIFRKILGVE